MLLRLHGGEVPLPRRKAPDFPGSRGRRVELACNDRPLAAPRVLGIANQTMWRLSIPGRDIAGHAVPDAATERAHLAPRVCPAAA